MTPFTNTKLFWNVHAMGLNGTEAEMLKAQWVTWRPNCVLVMEAGAFADELQALRPDALVVHRMVGVHGDANDEHMDVLALHGIDAQADLTPEQIQQIGTMGHPRHKIDAASVAAWGGPTGYIEHQMKHVFSDRRVIMQFMNEAGVRQSNVEYALQAVNFCHLRNQPIAVNLDGLGGPADNEVEIMRPLVARMLEINAERGRDFCYMMHHEYYPNHTPQFHGLRYDHNTHQTYMMHLDPLYCSPDLDPGVITNYANWYVGTYARMIYLFRERFGMDYPPVIIGEFGPDDLISKYKGWRPDPFAGAGDQSVLTQRQYGEHLLWLMRNVYHPTDPANPYYQYSKHVKGLTIFSYGDSGGWHTFDVTDTRFGEPTAHELFSMLEDYAMEEKTVLIDNEPIWVSYVVKAAILNVRATPGGVVIGELRQGDEVLLDVANPVEQGDYLWMHHAGGWSAVQMLDGSWYGMEPLPVDPPEDPPVEPPDPPQIDLSEYVKRTEVDALIAAAVAEQVAVAVGLAMLPVELWAKTMGDASYTLAGMLPEEAGEDELQALGEAPTPL